VNAARRPRPASRAFAVVPHFPVENTFGIPDRFAQAQLAYGNVRRHQNLEFAGKSHRFIARRDLLY
jgi:hypothetical protein